MTPQTNTTRTQTYSPETRGGTPEKENVLTNRLVTLVNHVARSEEYRTLRSQKVAHTDAFTGAVESIVDSPDNGFNNFDSALLTVTAGLGTCIEAQHELSTLEDTRAERSLTEEESERIKELKRSYLIPFNHNLKALINEGPNTTIGELSTALTRAHTAVFAPHNALHPESFKYIEDTPKPSAALYELNQRINAMRHEIAVETMLSAAGIEYDYNISIEEDARGIDMIVYLDGKRIPIDIKSSRNAVDRTLEKDPTAHAVATHLGTKHFTGMHGTAEDALCIPFSIAKNRAPLLVSDIRAIAQS